LELLTDSNHLANFYSANWPADVSTLEPDARILAGKESATYYGLPQDFNNCRWYCPESRQVWMFGTEYYGNLKITVRGLCSELASDEEMFIHGCALSLYNCGLILSGMSGAGKTTLTAALRQRLDSNVSVVNDDWGPLSLSSGLVRRTGEPYLHMKYPSVRSLAPALSIGPNTHRSENFQGDFNDPAARLLINPFDVFGQEGLCDDVTLKLFVVVIRNDSEPLSLRRLSTTDLSILERGHYSAFYQRSEQFLNGSLFLMDDYRLMRTRQQHRALLERFHCVALNNSGSPQRGAELIISALHACI
jgi:Phosphoenolpyruvate carboxykinase.